MMRHAVLGLLLGFSLLLAGGCVSIQPRVGTGPDGFPPDGGSIGVIPTPTAMPTTGGRPAILQVCRAHGRPSGYLAISYTMAGDLCPQNPNSDDPYNGAAVERFTDRPVGSIMVVCADQGIPGNWVRDHRRQVAAGCAGARVREGQPTTVRIRRVR
jgi:hypothetical protein